METTTEPTNNTSVTLEETLNIAKETTETTNLTDEDDEFVNTQKPNVNNEEKSTKVAEEEDDDLFGDKSFEAENGQEEEEVTTSKKKSKKSKKETSEDNNVDDLFDKEEEEEEEEKRPSRLKRFKTANNTEDVPMENTENSEEQPLIEGEEETSSKKKEDDPDYEDDYSEPEDKKKRKRSTKSKSKKDHKDKKEKSKSKKKSKKSKETTGETEGQEQRQEQDQEQDQEHEQEQEEERETEQKAKKENPFIEFERKKKIIKKISEEDAEAIAHKIIEKMRIAVKQDSISLKQGQPALKKLQLLPEVESLLHKKDLYNPLIDDDIFAVIKSWLVPLPNIRIKSSLLKVLANLPYDQEKIVSCGIFELVKNVRKNEKETPEVRKLAYDVIDKWTRPPPRNSNEFDKVHIDLNAIHNSTATAGVESSDGTLSKKKSIYLPVHVKHASSCERVKLDYTKRPVSVVSTPINSPMRTIHKIDKEIEKLKTPTIKGSPRAQTISIEGKKMILF